MHYKPRELENLLGIKPATLRLWATEFSDHLSPAAHSSQNDVGQWVPRRFDESDLATLRKVKDFRDQGLGYTDIKKHLADHLNPLAEPPPKAAIDRQDLPPDAPQTPPSNEMRLVLTTLHELAESRRKHVETLETLLVSVQSERDNLRAELEAIKAQSPQVPITNPTVEPSQPPTQRLSLWQRIFKRFKH